MLVSHRFASQWVVLLRRQRGHERDATGALCTLLGRHSGADGTLLRQWGVTGALMGANGTLPGRYKVLMELDFPTREACIRSSLMNRQSGDGIQGSVLAPRIDVTAGMFESCWFAIDSLVNGSSC